MTSAAHRLKELRLTARPRLSLRGAAEKLGMGHSSYGFYENPNYYKKAFLPVDLARKIAAVFAEHGIDPAEVMKLTGLTDTEVEPDVRSIEAAQPSVHYFTTQVALPSEAALTAMFDTLLALIPEDATRGEAAQILAQRLPTGFAAIGSGVIVEESDEGPDGDASSLTGAKDHRGLPRRSRN